MPTSDPRRAHHAVDRHIEGGGRVLGVVDGLDEVHDPAARAAADRALAALVLSSRQPGSVLGQLVVASRPVGWVAPAPDFAAAGDGREAVLDLVPFDRTAVEDYFDWWCAQQGGATARDRLRAATVPGSPLRDAVTVPLVAALCAWVAETEAVATTRTGLYEQVLRRFLQRRWKQDDPVGPVHPNLDSAWQGQLRLALARLAVAMADTPDGWTDIVEPDLCEALLIEGGAPPPPAPMSRTWSMCFDVGILTPIGVVDAVVDIPVGWAHRSFQTYLASVGVLAGDDPAGFLIARATDADWRDTIVFAAGAQPAGFLTRLCELGDDPLGLVADAIAAAVAEQEEVEPAVRDHVASRLAEGRVDPVLAASVVGAAALTHLDALVRGGDASREVYDAILSVGPEGTAALRTLVETEPAALGAAQALAVVAPDDAAHAVIRRAANGHPLAAQDARALRQAAPAVREAIRDRYVAAPDQLALADLAGAAGAPGTQEAFVGHLGHPSADARYAALNGLGILLSFDVPSDVVARVRRLAQDDEDPTVRATAANLVTTWETGTPGARQSRPSGEEQAARPRRRGTEHLLDLLAGTPDEVAQALALLEEVPAALAHPAIADAITQLEEAVERGTFDWRWAPSLVRMRPDLGQRLLAHITAGTMPAARDAAIALSGPTDLVEPSALLAALAAGMGRHPDKWLRAAFSAMADRYPAPAVRAVMATLADTGGPAATWRLIQAARSALERCDPAERPALVRSGSP